MSYAHTSNSIDIHKAASKALAVHTAALVVMAAAAGAVMYGIVKGFIPGERFYDVKIYTLGIAVGAVEFLRGQATVTERAALAAAAAKYSGTGRLNRTKWIFNILLAAIAAAMVFFGPTALRRMKRGVRPESYPRIFIGLAAVFTVVCLVRLAVLMKLYRRLPQYISLQDVPEDTNAGMKWPV